MQAGAGIGESCSDSDPTNEYVFRFLRSENSNQTSRRTKCLFRLIPSAEQHRTALDDVIVNNGGDILRDELLRSEYAVTFLNEKHYFDHPSQDCVLPFDTFSSIYIHDAVRAKANKLSRPDLNKYRLTRSQFEPFDANKILFQDLKWSDLVRLPGRKRTTVSTVKAQHVVGKWRGVLTPTKETENRNSEKEMNQTSEAEMKVQTSEAEMEVEDLEKDKEVQDSRIILVPGPSRNAAVSKPVVNLVVKGVAGPSNKTKAQRKPNSSTRSISPIRAHYNAVVGDDAWSSSDDVSYVEDDHESDAASRISDQSSNESKSPTRGRPPRQSFSIDEGQRILDLICAHKAFMYTKGNKLWQLIEASKQFPDRTHQSLKEHFRKQVLPKALKGQLYQMSPDDIKLLEKAQKQLKRTMHSNVCPDYKFKKATH